MSGWPRATGRRSPSRTPPRGAKSAASRMPRTPTWTVRSRPRATAFDDGRWSNLPRQGARAHHQQARGPDRGTHRRVRRARGHRQRQAGRHGHGGRHPRGGGSPALHGRLGLQARRRGARATWACPAAPCSATSRASPSACAAQIVPWNFPLLMATLKISPALAAGCTLILKPAEQTSVTALRLADFVAEAGFPPGVINVDHRQRPHGRRPAGEAPGRRQDRVHRLDRGRQDHQPQRDRYAQARHPGTRRQVARWW